MGAPEHAADNVFKTAEADKNKEKLSTEEALVRAAYGYHQGVKDLHDKTVHPQDGKAPQHKVSDEQYEKHAQKELREVQKAYKDMGVLADGYHIIGYSQHSATGKNADAHAQLLVTEKGKKAADPSNPKDKSEHPVVYAVNAQTGQIEGRYIKVDGHLKTLDPEEHKAAANKTDEVAVDDKGRPSSAHRKNGETIDCRRAEDGTINHVTIKNEQGKVVSETAYDQKRKQFVTTENGKETYATRNAPELDDKGNLKITSDDGKYTTTLQPNGSAIDRDTQYANRISNIHYPDGRQMKFIYDQNNPTAITGFTLPDGKYFTNSTGTSGYVRDGGWFNTWWFSKVNVDPATGDVDLSYNRGGGEVFYSDGRWEKKQV